MKVFDLKKDFGAVGNGIADDAPPFVAAANALTGTSGNTLYLPSGKYSFNSNPVINGRNMDSASLLFLLEGIKQLRIVGDGGRSARTTIVLNSHCGQLGARGQKQNGSNWARTTDIVAGAMSTQLIDPTKYILYTPDTYTLLSGLNIQDNYSVTPGGYGFPSNLQVFEYIQIDTVSSSGLITFKTPVRYSYLSTWPNINLGNAFEINAGGPAGMYSLFASWNLDVEWIGIRFESNGGNQLYNAGRRVVYRDCVFPNAPAPIPTQNGYWGTDRCAAFVLMETDKLIEEMEMIDTTWRGIDFQSASVRRSTLNRCIIDNVKLAGGGADFGVVKNCDIRGTFSPGAWAYGVCDASHCENSKIAVIAAGGFSEAMPGNVGVSNFIDKVNGTIIIPNGTNESNMTDNGAGKLRITIAPEYSAAQWKVGKWTSTGTTYQYINTVGITPIGTNVLTFASVPGWIVAGTPVLGVDSGYAGMPATGSTVVSATATTVTLSANMTGNRPTNSSVAFQCLPLNQKGALITAVNLANNTIDVDLNFPVGYVYGSSSGTVGNAAIRWAVPGHSVYWTGLMGVSKSFKVLSVTQDVNFTYVATDEPGGLPMSLVPNTGTINILTPGAQNATWEGITGPDLRVESLNAPESQNKPFGSYVKLQLTAGPLATSRFINMPQIWGHLVKIVVDVVTPYTGSAANCHLHFNQFDNLAINVDGVRQLIGWSVNTRLPGRRVITPADISSNPTALSGDVITIPNWSNIFWVNFIFNLWYRSVNTMGGGSGYVPVAHEDPSKWPLINIEVYTDHGFGVVAQKAVAADAGAYALTGTPATLRPMAVFSPIVVATESNVFGMSRSDPTQYLVPGNGNPAVSTSSYFNAMGLYNMRPCDLDTMGSAGAAVKAANGGRRYVWICSADHPNFSYGWRGQSGFWLGYSYQPWDMPKKMDEIIPHYNSWFSVIHNTSNHQTYEFPYFFYNPDDADGKPFYIYAETGPSNWNALWRSSDCVTWTVKDISHNHATDGSNFAFSSFQTYFRRNGPGDYLSVGWGTTPAPNSGYSVWTSTDALTYTTTGTAIFGGPNQPDASGVVHFYSHIFNVGPQWFAVGREERGPTAVANTQQVSIIPIDPVTFNKLPSPAKFVFTPTCNNLGFPGPTFMNGSAGYDEDGILYTYPTLGFPSDVNNANSSGWGGKPYTGPAVTSGGLDQQFVDKYAIRVDHSTARQAAPVGVAAACVSGTVTISWKDALPQNTYRVYRTATNPYTTTPTWTLIGDVTGISTTNSPPTGRYWYKVVTLDSGTEYKNRIVSVYVSNSTAFVNEHIDRVLDDGADITTINLSFLQMADALLDTVGIRNVLELWTHPAFGVNTSGSTIKVYDLGTTRLPRGEDYKATTATTTYSATGLNAGPCWVNANNNSYGYWGNPKRGNTINRKRQITLIAAYERTQTTEDITFFGTGPVWGNANDGNRILALKHTAAGNIEFSLSDETGVSIDTSGFPVRIAGTAGTKTATVAASGTGLKIAVGTYDGTSMKAYTGNTVGTSVTTLDPNPDFGLIVGGSAGTWVEGVLAGSRLNSANGSGADVVNVSGFGFKHIYPFLGSGAVHCYNLRANTVADDRKFIETNAKFNAQSMMVFEKALTSTQISDVVSFLQSPIAASAIANMGGGPNMVERSLFSSNTPMLPYSNWYLPGSGSPAISTSDYYNMSGMTWSRPYDLDAMGSDGATIKTANGGYRYIWIMMTDHGGNWPGSFDMMAGFSNDPQIWPCPTTVRSIHSGGAATSVTDQNGTSQTNCSLYQNPHLVYNPDPGAFAPFYIYGEGAAGGFQHELMLITTSDFVTTTHRGPAIPTLNFNGWTSYGKPERLGVNNWEVYAFGRIDGAFPSAVHYKYTSTDGWAWTPNYPTQVAGPGPYFTISGQKYMLAREDAPGGSFVSLLAVNSSNVSLGTYVRISTKFGDNTDDTIKAYPGPEYLQEQEAYEEDGIASIYATRGFAVSDHDGTHRGIYLDNHPSFYNIVGSITSNVLTVTSAPAGVPPLDIGFRLLGAIGSRVYIASFGTGTGGVGTYNTSTATNQASSTIKIATNGGLWNQFIDQYYYITNAALAANAAPLGVKAKCIAGTVTISWNNCLPNNTYRVYRGTTVATQATLIGDVTGVTTTNTPAPGVQYFYKVVTLNGGVEQKSRVVSVYASNNTEIVNRHVNRVINDGGDITKINMAFLVSADAWLTSNNAWRYVQCWTDVRFGVKENGGFITKIYDLGATYMPRSGDYIPTSSNTIPASASSTSYSATSFRGTTPSWINTTNVSRGAWGNGRGSNIQRWSEITLLAAYQRPNSTGSIALFGYGENSGLYLQQAAGTAGNITFAMVCDKPAAPSVFTNATAPFTTATAPHVAAGVFDGTNMICYLDGVAGTPQSGGPAANNYQMLNDTILRGQFSLAAGSQGQGGVLASGSRSGRFDYIPRLYNLSSNEAQFTGAGLAVFNKGLSATLVQSWGALYS